MSERTGEKPRSFAPQLDDKIILPQGQGGGLCTTAYRLRHQQRATMLAAKEVRTETTDNPGIVEITTISTPWGSTFQTRKIIKNE